MSGEIPFHFKIRVGDIEVEASGPEEFVRELRSYAEQLVTSGLARTRTIGAIIPDRESSGDQSDSIRPSSSPTGEPLGKDEFLGEFLERLPNKTHQDKILAFGYFMEKNRGIQSFGAKEINDCYEEVKETKSNTAQYLTLLVKSCLINESQSANRREGATKYVLTRTGVRTIEEVLGTHTAT